MIGEACGTLPDDLRSRHPEVDWKGWRDFRNLTTHAYWRADAAIAAEAMELAIPVMVGLVASEIAVAAQAAGVDPTAPELTWSLAGPNDRPATDQEVLDWWRKQRKPAPEESS